MCIAQIYIVRYERRPAGEQRAMRRSTHYVGIGLDGVGAGR